MPPKKFKLNETHGFIGDTDYKSKPRDIPMEIFLNMVVARDRIFYAEAKAKGDTKTMEFLTNRHKK